jgi:serine/threonine protein kinase
MSSNGFSLFEFYKIKLRSDVRFCVQDLISIQLYQSSFFINFSKYHPDDQPELIKMVKNEVRIHMYFRHPNLMTARFAWQDNKNIYILMDKMHCTDVAYKGIRNEKDMMIVLISSARGLANLHVRKIVHRDMKPDNIFLNYESDMKTIAEVRVGDFNTSKSRTHNTTIGGFIGTPGYMAPEVETYQGSGDYKVDVFSFGVIIAECIRKRVPTKHRPITLQELEQTNPSPMVMELIKIQQRCVAVDPNERPDMRIVVYELENLMLEYLVPKQ